MLQVCKSRFSASGIRGAIRVVRYRVKVFIRIEGLRSMRNLIVVQASNIDLMVLRSITIQSYTRCSARVVTCEFPPEPYFQVRSYKRIRYYPQDSTVGQSSICGCASQMPVNTIYMPVIYYSSSIVQYKGDSIRDPCCIFCREGRTYFRPRTVYLYSASPAICIYILGRPRAYPLCLPRATSIKLNATRNFCFRNR